MFDFLRGPLAHCAPHKAVIDVGGIGYLIFISVMTFEKLPQIGEETKLFTSVVIREDSHKIFGFLSADDRDFFETLNDISGVGPRISISILGHMSLEDLHLAVEHANTKALTKIPGVGKKMAERLVLELRDKIQKFDKERVSLSSLKARGAVGDAINALINLGYKPIDAQSAVKNVLAKEEAEPPLAELISLALKAKKP